MNIGEVRKELISFLGGYWDRTQDFIVRALASDIELLDETNKSILAHSGKQMRPMLCLLTASACSGGKINEDSCRYAAAVELLHNATLLHDDVADDSLERRGVPTVYSTLGGTASVLVGDFWLVRSVNLVLESGNSEEMVRMFARTMQRLAEGEMLQLQKAEYGDTTEEEYLKIIYCKTASLFETACVSGAVSVNADAALTRAASEYARWLGMAFQIKDDMLDYSGGELLGKSVGVDIRERKITLPLLGAMMNAGADAQAELRKMVREVESHPESVGYIQKFVLSNGGMEYAQSRADEFLNKAIEVLEAFPDSRAKEYLVWSARFASDRKL